MDVGTLIGFLNIAVSAEITTANGTKVQLSKLNMEQVKTALDRQMIPKIPMHGMYCQVCETLLIKRNGQMDNHCPYCGQKVGTK